MTTKQKLNANAAYENAHLVSQDLAQRISELLFEMPAPDSNAINWAHVGSLNHINHQLSEIVRFMEGR